MSTPNTVELSSTEKFQVFTTPEEREKSIEERKKDEQTEENNNNNNNSNPLETSNFAEHQEEGSFDLQDILEASEKADLSFDQNVFNESDFLTAEETFLNEMIPKVSNRLAVYFNPKCVGHLVPQHPEQPKRVEIILNALRNRFKNHSDVFFRESTEVTDEQILLFHTTRVLDSFKKKWEETYKFYESSKKVIFRDIDGDTSVMHRTKDAAYYAAGSVINAVDHIYLPKGNELFINAAFCCVRPPGHHAEPNKSGGFCFFNNVAIGAMYAREKYQIQKIAVLDFDVHHGNGTEAGFQDDETLFYGSTHEKYCYPGTGHDPSPFVGNSSKNPLHRRIVDRFLNAGPSSRTEFHKKWIEILKEMELFQPNLIFISAGFDAHDDDPLASCELIDCDYEWITKEILKSGLRINFNSPPPVISVLEGGYDLDAIKRSSLLHVNRLYQGYNEELKQEVYQELHPEEGHGGNEIDALKDALKEMGI